MMNKEEFIQLLQDKKYKTAQNILSEMNDMEFEDADISGRHVFRN